MVDGSDPRLAVIDRELARPLSCARAAEERVWASLRSTKASTLATGGPVLGAMLAFAAAAVLFLAIGWAQGVRVEVASGGLPTLYRLEVGRVELAAPGARGTLAIGERHLRDPDRLSAVADASVRLQQSALPAEVEIRFLEEGQSAHGVLARTSQITDAPANGTVVAHEAPFPPLARGERRIYRVWLHVRASGQAHDTARLVVEVSGAAKGQRVRVVATEP